MYINESENNDSGVSNSMGLQSGNDVDSDVTGSDNGVEENTVRRREYAGRRDYARLYDQWRMDQRRMDRLERMWEQRSQNRVASVNRLRADGMFDEAERLIEQGMLEEYNRLIMEGRVEEGNRVRDYVILRRNGVWDRSLLPRSNSFNINALSGIVTNTSSSAVGSVSVDLSNNTLPPVSNSNVSHVGLGVSTSNFSMSINSVQNPVNTTNNSHGNSNNIGDNCYNNTDNYYASNKTNNN